MMNGKGKLNYSNGNEYSGTFVKGKKEGKGVYFWKTSGLTFQGGWKEDKMHGEGVITNNEGSTRKVRYLLGQKIDEKGHS